jgi:hypothetical protein
MSFVVKRESIAKYLDIHRRLEIVTGTHPTSSRVGMRTFV